MAKFKSKWGSRFVTMNDKKPTADMYDWYNSDQFVPPYIRYNNTEYRLKAGAILIDAIKDFCNEKNITGNYYIFLNGDFVYQNIPPIPKRIRNNMIIEIRPVKQSIKP